MQVAGTAMCFDSTPDRIRSLLGNNTAAAHTKDASYDFSSLVGILCDAGPYPAASITTDTQSLQARQRLAHNLWSSQGRDDNNINSRPCNNNTMCSTAQTL
jgi:hypothetical protein